MNRNTELSEILRWSLWQSSCSFKATFSLGSTEASGAEGFVLCRLWLQQPRLEVVMKAAPHLLLLLEADQASRCHQQKSAGDGEERGGVNH